MPKAIVLVAKVLVKFRSVWFQATLTFAPRCHLGLHAVILCPGFSGTILISNVLSVRCMFFTLFKSLNYDDNENPAVYTPLSEIRWGRGEASARKAAHVGREET